MNLTEAAPDLDFGPGVFFYYCIFLLKSSILRINLIIIRWWCAKFDTYTAISIREGNRWKRTVKTAAAAAANVQYCSNGMFDRKNLIGIPIELESGADEK